MSDMADGGRDVGEKPVHTDEEEILAEKFPGLEELAENLPAEEKKDEKTEVEKINEEIEAYNAHRAREVKKFLALSDADKLYEIRSLVQWARETLPPKYCLFELFSAHLEIFDLTQTAELYGFIEVEDRSGPVCYFDRDQNDALTIQKDQNSLWIPLTGPDPCRIPSTRGKLNIDIEMYIKVGDKVTQLNNHLMRWDYRLHKKEITYYDSCENVTKHENGVVKLYYVPLKRAVRATVKVQLLDDDGGVFRDCYGTIVACYGNFEYTCKPEKKKYFQMTLFEMSRANRGELKVGEDLFLSRSVVAVPAKCSIVMTASFKDAEDKEILTESIEVPAQLNGTTLKSIFGNGYQFQFEIDWFVDKEQKSDTESEDEDEDEDEG